MSISNILMYLITTTTYEEYIIINDKSNKLNTRFVIEDSAKL